MAIFYEELFKWWHVRLKSPKSKSATKLDAEPIEVEDSGDESRDLSSCLSTVKTEDLDVKPRSKNDTPTDDDVSDFFTNGSYMGFEPEPGPAITDAYLELAPPSPDVVVHVDGKTVDVSSPDDPVRQGEPNELETSPCLASKPDVGEPDQPEPNQPETAPCVVSKPDVCKNPKGFKEIDISKLTVEEMKAKVVQLKYFGL